MQFVRTYLVFGLLRYLAVLVRRQQLRRNRCITYIQQDRAERFAIEVLRRIAHEVPHKRFGDSGVDRVHRHLVAVVGTPAKCQFAQIAGTDHQAVQLIRQIHQNQRAHTGLGVFIGDVMVFHIMAYIAQMLRRGLPDRYLAMGDTKFFHQPECVLVCSVARTESGHGHPYYTRAVIAQEVRRLHTDQQGQRAVQSAGYTYLKRFSMRVLPSPRQSGCLDREYIHAILVFLVFPGQERRRGEETVNRRSKLFLALYRCYIDMTVMPCLVFGEIGVALSIRPEPLHVNLLNDHGTDPLEPFAFT